VSPLPGELPAFSVWLMIIASGLLKCFPVEYLVLGFRAEIFVAKRGSMPMAV
jgi:hypothetical protein